MHLSAESQGLTWKSVQKEEQATLDAAGAPLNLKSQNLAEETEIVGPLPAKNVHVVYDNRRRPLPHPLGLLTHRRRGRVSR